MDNHFRRAYVLMRQTTLNKCIFVMKHQFIISPVSICLFPDPFLKAGTSLSLLLEITHKVFVTLWSCTANGVKQLISITNQLYACWC